MATINSVVVFFFCLAVFTQDAAGFSMIRMRDSKLNLTWPQGLAFDEETNDLFVVSHRKTRLLRYRNMTFNHETGFVNPPWDDSLISGAWPELIAYASAVAIFPSNKVNIFQDGSKRTDFLVYSRGLEVFAMSLDVGTVKSILGGARAGNTPGLGAECVMPSNIVSLAVGPSEAPKNFYLYMVNENAIWRAWPVWETAPWLQFRCSSVIAGLTHSGAGGLREIAIASNGDTLYVTGWKGTNASFARIGPILGDGITPIVTYFFVPLPANYDDSPHGLAMNRSWEHNDPEKHQLFYIDGHMGGIYQIDFNRTESSQVYYMSSTKVFMTVTARCPNWLCHQDKPRNVLFLPDGTILGVTTDNGIFYQVNGALPLSAMKTLKSTPPVPARMHVSSLDSSNFPTASSCKNDSALVSGKPVYTLKGVWKNRLFAEVKPSTFVIDPVGQRLVVGTRVDCRLHQMNLNTGVREPITGPRTLDPNYLYKCTYQQLIVVDSPNAIQAQVRFPAYLLVGQTTGHIYFSDGFGKCIRRFNGATHAIETIAGNCTGAYVFVSRTTWSDARYRSISGMISDEGDGEGNFIVGDGGSKTLRILYTGNETEDYFAGNPNNLSATGAVIGATVDGPLDTIAQINSVGSMTIHPVTKTIYLVDSQYPRSEYEIRCIYWIPGSSRAMTTLQLAKDVIKNGTWFKPSVIAYYAPYDALFFTDLAPGDAVPTRPCNYKFLHLSNNSVTRLHWNDNMTNSFVTYGNNPVFLGANEKIRNLFLQAYRNDTQSGIRARTAAETRLNNSILLFDQNKLGVSLLTDPMVSNAPDANQSEARYAPPSLAAVKPGKLGLVVADGNSNSFYTVDTTNHGILKSACGALEAFADTPDGRPNAVRWDLIAGSTLELGAGAGDQDGVGPDASLFNSPRSIDLFGIRITSFNPGDSQQISRLTTLTLLIADTGNSKIKALALDTHEVITVATEASAADKTTFVKPISIVTRHKNNTSPTVFVVDQDLSCIVMGKQKNGTEAQKLPMQVVFSVLVGECKTGSTGDLIPGNAISGARFGTSFAGTSSVSFSADGSTMYGVLQNKIWKLHPFDDPALEGNPDGRMLSTVSFTTAINPVPWLTVRVQSSVYTGEPVALFILTSTHIWKHDMNYTEGPRSVQHRGFRSLVSTTEKTYQYAEMQDAIDIQLPRAESDAIIATIKGDPGMVVVRPSSPLDISSPSVFNDLPVQLPPEVDLTVDMVVPPRPKTRTVTMSGIKTLTREQTLTSLLPQKSVPRTPSPTLTVIVSLAQSPTVAVAVAVSTPVPTAQTPTLPLPLPEKNVINNATPTLTFILSNATEPDEKDAKLRKSMGEVPLGPLTNIGKVGAVLAALVAAVFSPMAAARVPAISYAVRASVCVLTPDESPTLLSMPIQFTIGEGSKAIWTGSLAAAAGFIFIALLIVLGMALSGKLEEAEVEVKGGETANNEKVELTSSESKKTSAKTVVVMICALVASYFFPSVFGAATGVVQSGGAVQKIVAVGACLVLMMVLGFCFKVSILECPQHCTIASEVAAEKSDDPPATEDAKGQESDGLEPPSLGWGASPDYTYTSKKHWPNYFSIFCIFFDAARLAFKVSHRLVFFEEIIIGTMQGVVGGWDPSSKSQCETMSLWLLVVATAHLFYMLVLRPYASYSDLFFSVTNGLCVAALGVLGVIYGSLDLIGLIAWVQTGLFIAQPVLAIGMWAKEKMNQKKEKTGTIMKKSGEDDCGDGLQALLIPPTSNTQQQRANPLKPQS